MHIRSLLLLAAALCSTAIARADDFAFTLNGGVGSFISGTGVLTGDATGSNGAYLIRGITGTNVTGLIGVGDYSGNNNLFYPTATTNFDSSGLGFYAQNPGGTYEVKLYASGSSYFAYVTEINTTQPFSVTVPVTFTVASAATPEPTGLALLGTGALALVGAARRRFAAAA